MFTLIDFGGLYWEGVEKPVKTTQKQKKKLSLSDFFDLADIGHGF